MRAVNVTQQGTPASDSTDATRATPQTPDGGTHDLQPLPLDITSPQFTWRAVLTGVVLAFVLSSCNVYLGLKLGIGLNMAITAALLAYGFWAGVHALTPARPLGLLENNISLTAAAAGASVASAGLVGPIPALTMLTGQALPWYWLTLWIFSVCLVGISVAIGLRRQMILVDKLPFVTGVATAETLRALYSTGREALRRVIALTAAAVVAAAFSLAGQIFPFWPAQVVLPVTFSVKGLAAKALTFGLNTTLLFYAVGGLIGIRVCVSLALGAVLAWGVLAPTLIQSGYLRLEVAETLSALPAGVVLHPEPDGHARYDRTKHQLVWKGVMTAAERAALLALSDDEAYGEAVGRLFGRSQLELAAPLAALPPGVTLPPDSPVAFDGQRGLLIARRGVDREKYAALRAQSQEAAYGTALDTLQEYFTYTTTRRMRVSEPQTQLPAELSIPPPLTDRVRYDANAGTLRATGILTQADAKMLLTALPTDHLAFRLMVEGLRLSELTALPAEHLAFRDYQATVDALVAASAFRPVEPTFSGVVTWLLWPGVALMVVASLVSFGFSWRSIFATFAGRHQAVTASPPVHTGEVSRRWFIRTLALSLVLSVVLQVWFFDIKWWTAGVGVLLSFLLAVVAGRVAGETNITPVAPVGKVTQLLFGALLPARVEPNLMAANVTGGAASQCAELLHDLKCGYLLGATPRLQVWAQIWGALAGSLSGSLVYLNLIQDPQQRLLTEEWPAPMVAGMKAVAELFQSGFGSFPRGAPQGMLIASLVAVVLVVLEKKSSKKVRPYLPSAASLGLAFIIPANASLTMLVGALVALLLSKSFQSLAKRYLVTICVGVVAGESLTGVGMSLYRIIVEWSR
jgi:uncharacterized oligopeptide transporter (OPT) family protein